MDPLWYEFRSSPATFLVNNRTNVESLVHDLLQVRHDSLWEGLSAYCLVYSIYDDSSILTDCSIVHCLY